MNDVMEQMPDLLADLDRVRTIVVAARNYVIAHDALAVTKTSYNERGTSVTRSQADRLLDALCEAESQHSNMLMELRKALGT